MCKFMKLIFPALMAIFILAVPLEAQKKAKDARAQAAFDAGEYHKAIDLYKDAYSKVDREQKTAIFFKVGECYRIIGDARSATLWYTKAIREDYQDPVIYLRYGQMLLVNEKYSEAEEEFKKIGLSPTYGLLLMLLDEWKELTPSQLSNYLDIKPSTTTRFLDKLQKIGLFDLCTIRFKDSIVIALASSIPSNFEIIE